MKLDLELLFTNLSRTEEYTGIPRDGVNDYLIDKILLPSMNGETVHLRDIDFDAFSVEDIGALGEFHDKMESQAEAVDRLAAVIGAICPIAAGFRAFC